MPEFYGGKAAFLKFFTKNFRYPKQETFQASFMVELVINEDGKVVDQRIKGKTKALLTAAEKEVLRTISNSPK